MKDWSELETIAIGVEDAIESPVVTCRLHNRFLLCRTRLSSGAHITACRFENSCLAPENQAIYLKINLDLNRIIPCMGEA